MGECERDSQRKATRTKNNVLVLSREFAGLGDFPVRYLDSNNRFPAMVGVFHLVWNRFLFQFLLTPRWCFELVVSLKRQQLPLELVF